MFSEYKKQFPELAKKYKSYYNEKAADFSGLSERLKTEKDEATRISGGIIINEIAKPMSNLLPCTEIFGRQSRNDFRALRLYGGKRCK